MRFLLVFSTFLILASTSLAQNLVANPSFENYSNTYCGIMSSQFSSIIDNWYLPTGGTSDAYFTNINTTCFNYQPNSQYGGPIGIKGNQVPRTGNVMAGIGAFTIPNLNQREYIQVQLNATLTIGKSYVVEFYVSLADSVEKSINSLGAHLSTNAITSGGTTPLSSYTPQVVATSFLDNVTDWILVRDTITALAAYEYITIGNFLDDASTSTQSNPNYSGKPGTYGSYYYIDDVRVEEISSVITTVDKVSTKSIDSEIKIYPNPSKGILYIEQSVEQTDIVEVFHLNGTLIKQLEITDRKSAIDLNELNNGAYILRIISDTGVNTHPFVLQK